MKAFDLTFHPNTTSPTDEGWYLLYNQCDGYHLAEATFDDTGEFDCFWNSWEGKNSSGMHYGTEMYCAWAKLPDTLKDLYDTFARK